MQTEIQTEPKTYLAQCGGGNVSANLDEEIEHKLAEPSSVALMSMKEIRKNTTATTTMPEVLTNS